MAAEPTMASYQDKPGTASPAVSHFGGGVLTFHIPCLFRTDPGVDLFVTGPINRPKDAISALSGVIETDWSPYTFTMNWPFRHLFPVQRGEFEKLAPSLHRLSENPDLEREHKLWPELRNTFNASLADPASKAAQDEWQKTYFRGKAPSGAPAPEGHRSRLRLCPFKDTDL